MFIGRKEELLELHQLLNNKLFESVLIYGRRRIGKTELIRESVKNYSGKVIYFEAKKSIFQDNLKEMQTIVQSVFQINYEFRSFYDLCAYLFNLSEASPVVLIIDELPYLINSNPSVISDLRNLIDTFRGRSSAKFIVSGSYIDIMKRLIESDSEVYGRFSHIIPLQPFDYYDASAFYPDYSPEDKLLMYACFGGVAFFNSLADPDLTAKENILNLLIKKNSILQLEIENTIANETNKIPQMNSIIGLIGEGYTKYSQLTSILRTRAGKEINVDYPLRRLLEMEIIRKETPINDPSNKKRTFYRFNDHLIEFYYRFIFPNASRNSVLSPDSFYKMFVEKEMTEHYLPYIFEEAAKEFLIRINRKGMIQPPFYNIGTYSYNDALQKRNIQFDAVTEDENGYISYECKYKNQPIGDTVIHQEEVQRNYADMNIYKLGFISKNGFLGNPDPEKYNLYTLSDFYNLPDQ